MTERITARLQIQPLPPGEPEQVTGPRQNHPYDPNPAVKILLATAGFSHLTTVFRGTAAESNRHHSGKLALPVEIPLASTFELTLQVEVDRAQLVENGL